MTFQQVEVKMHKDCLLAVINQNPGDNKPVKSCLKKHRALQLLSPSVDFLLSHLTTRKVAMGNGQSNLGLQRRPTSDLSMNVQETWLHCNMNTWVWRCYSLKRVLRSDLHTILKCLTNIYCKNENLVNLFYYKSIAF